MLRRTILPDEAGVLYEGNARRILWAFRDLELPVDANTRVADLVATIPVDVTDGRLFAHARRVYAIG
jgi:hypothetical protein